MGQNITLIFNPIAGAKKRKGKIIDYLERTFVKHGHRTALCETSKRGEATEFAKQALCNHADVVVAIGGDGTINEIGSALVHTGVPLGIVPAGSGNGLARSLNIPQNVEQASEVILRGLTCRIDVGKANNNYFFLLAGLGFDAVVGKKFDEHSKRGPIPYFYLGAKEYFGYKPEWMEVSFNQVSRKIQPFVMAVANGGQYGNGAIIAPEAKLNDGLLDVCIVTRLSFLQLFSAIPKLFQGKLKSYRDVEFHTTRKIRIVREAPGLVNIDGEPIFEEATVEISLLPKSLNVIVPRNSPGLNR
ncbi:MAG: diacylglycerol/lipid kinase family protein [bacterium]